MSNGVTPSTIIKWKLAALPADAAATKWTMTEPSRMSPPSTANDCANALSRTGEDEVTGLAEVIGLTILALLTTTLSETPSRYRVTELPSEYLSISGCQLRK